MRRRRRHGCDRCGAAPATPVVHGYPSAERLEQARRGEVLLGGCGIGPDEPRWLCRRCAGDEPAPAQRRSRPDAKR